jgi:hypothetical protein
MKNPLVNLTIDQRNEFRKEMKSAFGDYETQAQISLKWEAIGRGETIQQPAAKHQNNEPLKVNFYRDHMDRLRLRLPKTDPLREKQAGFGFDLLVEKKSMADIETILKNRTDSHGMKYEIDRLSFYEPEAVDPFDYIDKQ